MKAKERIIRFVLSRDGIFTAAIIALGARVLGTEMLTPAYDAMGKALTYYCERVPMEARDEWRRMLAERIAPNSLTIHCDGE